MALDLPLPKKIYAHGFIMMKDGKMSKSKGNVVYPEMLIDRYGLDAFKYFLLREFTFGQDAVFSPEGFIERFNFDLCNDLGNLLNRTIGMINKYFDGTIQTNLSVKTEFDDELEKFTNEKIQAVEQCMDNYHISNALENIWSIISRTNKYIDETAPWVLAKNEEMDKLASVMYHLSENLRKISIMIMPIMNNTGNDILRQLGINEKELHEWESIKNEIKIKDGTKVIEKGEPLFMRLDMEEEISYIKEKMKK